MPEARVFLEASRSRVQAGLRTYPDPDPSTRVEVTIVLRRRSASEVASAGRLDAILRGEAPAMSREEAAVSLGADPADLQQVAEFAESHGLAVVESSLAKRTVRVAGTVAQMEAAFGVKLHSCETSGRVHLCYEGALSIPATLDGIVVAVLGLDQRPVARR
jgi:kumamolisin